MKYVIWRKKYNKVCYFTYNMKYNRLGTLVADWANEELKIKDL